MKNQLIIGDNLPIMVGMPDAFADLIYLDPPFNSKTFRRGKTEKHSFKDTWTHHREDYAAAIYIKQQHPAMWELLGLTKIMHGVAMHNYLMFMASRLVQIHKLLKPTGSCYLHCDPSANYYLRILMDNIFGAKNFRNEIVWCYAGGGTPRNDFPRKHDTILRYSKSPAFIFHKEYKPYKENTQQVGKHSTLSGGEEIDLERGTPVTDWWTDIKTITGWSPERTGYATQKPLKLLNRIIAASSNPGDLVLDPFCGCATACVSAAHLQRKFIGIDQNKLALEILQDRLADTTYSYETKIPGEAKIVKPVRRPRKEFPDSMSPAKAKKILVERDLRAFNQVICKGCLKKFPDGKLVEVDHKVAKDFGGPDRLKNYQLLCGRCNQKKGNKSMEYLHQKLAEEELQERLAIQKRLAKVEQTFGDEI